MRTTRRVTRSPKTLATVRQFKIIMGKRILDYAEKIANPAPKTASCGKLHPNLRKGKKTVSVAKSSTKQKQKMKKYHDKMRKQMHNFNRELRKTMVVVPGAIRPGVVLQRQ